MQTIKTAIELRRTLAKARSADKRVGFVPTMGYLHDGHLALVAASRVQSDVTVVSIFVNPTQFGPNEDLSTYPRDFSRDEKLCRDAGVAILFAPSAQEVYPSQFETFVEPGDLAKPLCGALRPGHFRGVATVVCKLFNMVQPDVVFFGQKDFQQCAVVRRMAIDLNLPIEIVTVPTVRETDGLAMSSRNRYLSKEERRRALESATWKSWLRSPGGIWRRLTDCNILNLSTVTRSSPPRVRCGALRRSVPQPTLARPG